MVHHALRLAPWLSPLVGKVAVVDATWEFVLGQCALRGKKRGIQNDTGERESAGDGEPRG